MKVAKTFRWEAAHRLPKHPGLCRHLHGHSYRMTVEMEGMPDSTGLVVDFADIKSAVIPLVDQWDHATLIAADDVELLSAVDKLGDRRFVLPVETTAENLCLYVADYIRRESASMLSERSIEVIRVRIQETGTCFAECETRVVVAESGTLGKADWVRLGEDR